jgi:2-amino-4-hydroxy-6-hydroxymethyldihydropteridine diphosphokinase
MTLPKLPIVYISLGSNIEPEHHLGEAIRLLREYGTILAVSSVYQTPPYGNPHQPDFLDVALKLTTSLTPEDFKTQALDTIEKQLGRDRANQTNKYGPLTLDMDILLWGDQAFVYGSKPWRVPDSGILKTAAVALPLAEIAPDVIHPETGETLAQIAARLDRSGIKKLALAITDDQPG